MKKFLLAIFSLASTHVFAKDGYPEPPTKWSVGILAVGHYQGPFSGYGFQLLPGVQVNRHFEKFNLHAALEHTRYNNVSMPGIYYSWLNGFSNRTLLRVGVERNIITVGRFRAYVAADLAYHYTYSEFDRNGCFGPIGRTHTKAQGAGFIPSLGAEYKIGNRLAVFAEYRAELFLSDVKEKTNTSGTSEAIPYRYTSFDYNFGSIGHAGFRFSF